MSNNFDYGFDINIESHFDTVTKEKIETNEVGDRISNGNEYNTGEKEAIEQWLKSHKKISN